MSLSCDRFAVLRVTDHERFQLVDVVMVHDAANLVVAVGHLDRAPAGFLQRRLQRVDELLQR